MKRIICYATLVVLTTAACGSDSESSSSAPETDAGTPDVTATDTEGDGAGLDVGDEDDTSPDPSPDGGGDVEVPVVCDAPFADCVTDDEDPCETDTASDPAHCGGCDQPCEVVNGTAACADSVCEVTCSEGFMGPTCEEPKPSCDDDDFTCQANAACQMMDEAPVCVCDAYFQLDGDLCVGICGDGILVEGEACDDGNTVAGDGCRADCLGVEECGDGLLDVVTEEECDDGNEEPGDGCDDRCEVEPFEGPCGDGVVNLGEDCDDGNADASDGCDDCQLTLTDAWTCDPAIFKASDGCDCGCGQVDADCEDATVESCDFCGGEGTCNSADATCQLIKDENNGACK